MWTIAGTGLSGVGDRLNGGKGKHHEGAENSRFLKAIRGVKNQNHSHYNNRNNPEKQIGMQK